jgi:F0F1-type ATP synthase assembly protein I
VGTITGDFLLTATAVPEPTTLISGVLLLLPFGASTLRILRKNRTS